MPKPSWREFDNPIATSRPNNSGHTTAKADRQVRVKSTRGGKGGKTVTLISGLELDPVEARVLLKILKSRCGTGGTLKEGNLELQGDKVLDALELLKKEGFRPKKSGG